MQSCLNKSTNNIDINTGAEWISFNFHFSILFCNIFLIYTSQKNIKSPYNVKISYSAPHSSIHISSPHPHFIVFLLPQSDSHLCLLHSGNFSTWVHTAAAWLKK